MAHNEARDGDEVTGTYRYESVFFSPKKPIEKDVYRTRHNANIGLTMFQIEVFW